MDQELKQRMIGAAVIIALAVIFVPMLFDGDIEEKHNKNISINIPEEPDNNLEVKKFSIDKPVSESVDLPTGDVELAIKDKKPVLIPKEQVVEEKPATSTATESVKKEPLVVENNADSSSAEQKKPEPVVEKPVETVVETQPVKQAESQIKPQTKPQNKPNQNQSVAQAYRVKLGSFSQKGNAEKVKTSLLQKNIKSMVEYNPGLKLYRVWSQEIYRSENTAKQYVDAVKKLKLNIGTPKVITLAASEIEGMATQGQLGWVVQLGSFAEKKNAIELRNKVNAAGFQSFVDQVSSSNGKTMYRLRVGPLMEKMDAEKTQTEIKTKLRLNGLIKSHELSQIVD